MILNITQCLPYSMLWSKQGCCCSIAKSCLTLCDPMNCSPPGFPVLHSLQEFAQIHDHWVAAAIQSSHPLLPPSSPVLNLSQHQGLSSESALRIRWPEYWSFSFSISLSKDYSGLISFRIDRFDLFAVQGTLCHTTVWKHQFCDLQEELCEVKLFS